MHGSGKSCSQRVSHGQNFRSDSGPELLTLSLSIVVKSVWFIKIRVEELWTKYFEISNRSHLLPLTYSSFLHYNLPEKITETVLHGKTKHSSQILTWTHVNICCSIYCVIQGFHTSVTSGLLHQPLSHVFLVLHWHEDETKGNDPVWVYLDSVVKETLFKLYGWEGDKKQTPCLWAIT